MRAKLALNFAYLVLCLYAIAGLASLAMFYHGMTRATESLLFNSLAEIRPAVKIVEQHASLKEWAAAASSEDLPVLATVQVFDQKNNLIEHYGPDGAPRLGTGHLTTKTVSVRSANQKIIHEGINYGTLQVQVSTAQDDRAIAELAFAICIGIPIIAALVSLGGYFFAGQALQPVETTMDLLRRFVADAGHELKTPISIIEACIETLQDMHQKEGLPDTQIQMLRSASTRMRGLTADLMFLAKVEDPMYAFDKRNIALDHLVASVVDEYKPLAETSNVSLDVTTDEKVTIYAEPEAFRQLMSNLISNAVKYTDTGGSVKVGLSKDGIHAVITVTDTGIGIPQNSLPNIFDRFYRVDKSRSREAGGVGLGLSIVKAVAEAHGSLVIVNSEVGKGTTFTVTVPLSQ
ncbi:MAG: HAMP domain-containing sensor histidine kinase [Candidatus Obscuribacterales bacterium]